MWAGSGRPRGNSELENGKYNKAKQNKNIENNFGPKGGT